MNDINRLIEQKALTLLNDGMVLNEVEKISGYELIAFKDINGKYIRVNLWKELSIWVVE